MVRPMLIPDNKTLAQYALQRPNFYALRSSAQNAGALEPQAGPHGLRWTRANNDEKRFAPVDVNALRLAQTYVHESYRTGNKRILYLFVYAPSEDGHGTNKYYYTIHEPYVDVWFDEPQRMRMLRDLEPEEQSA